MAVRNRVRPWPGAGDPEAAVCLEGLGRCADVGGRLGRSRRAANSAHRAQQTRLTPRRTALSVIGWVEEAVDLVAGGEARGQPAAEAVEQARGPRPATTSEPAAGGEGPAAAVMGRPPRVFAFLPRRWRCRCR